MRRRYCLSRILGAIILAASVAPGVFAQEPNGLSAAATFVTLGTNGGPVSQADRSEPANAILIGRDVYLVDVGDGACQQLSKVKISIGQVKAVFISHLHFDHVGGLSALIGLRNQLGVPGVLEIYGPPGTRALVDGLVTATIPSARAAYGYADKPFADPAGSVKVIELVDGSSVQSGPLKATARQNTHYSFAPGSEMDRRYKSLAFRFDVPGRSIAYTGDTGPSPAVEELAKGADLLVSEMIDLEKVTATVQPTSTGQDIPRHLREHHVTPDQVGEIAARANVGELVITHLVAPRATAADLMRYEAAIRRHYGGPVIVANDLDEF